jgi:small-conductance mechanosensitive channel
MDELLVLKTYESYLETTWAWLVQNAVSLGLSGMAQIVVVGLAFLAARQGAARGQSLLDRVARGWRYGQQLRRVAIALEPLTLPILWLLVQWLALLIAAQAMLPHQLIKIVASLLTAWVAIRLTTTLVRDATWSRLIAMAAWTIAALNILNLLEPASQLLDSIALSFGNLRISALIIIKAALSLALLLWLAAMAGRLLERRITTLPNLTPSLQVLLSKLFKILLTIVAIAIALTSVGIDLTAFAVFSGAVGVGVGFGLQRVISNFISGVILLLDRSVKPGDVISVGQTYGWVGSLGARYVSVVTRDDTEYLIPNEDLITHQVVNWSYSNNQVRLRLPIAVSYDADVREARDLCLEAAAETPRVMSQPAPVCVLTAFGESAVELELRIWIQDPKNGVGNVKSDVLLRVWDKFRAGGIQFPYPQREVHLKTPIEVALREPHATSVERPPEREDARGRPPLRPRSSTGG